tara:strand:- start:2315 stop:2425 length:111 start_codon:yes stop_codon:yes gene_type:complete
MVESLRGAAADALTTVPAHALLKKVAAWLFRSPLNA